MTTRICLDISNVLAYFPFGVRDSMRRKLRVQALTRGGLACDERDA